MTARRKKLGKFMSIPASTYDQSEDSVSEYSQDYPESDQSESEVEDPPVFVRQRRPAESPFAPAEESVQISAGTLTRPPVDGFMTLPICAPTMLGIGIMLLSAVYLYYATFIYGVVPENDETTMTLEYTESLHKTNFEA
jgi:hypothetical protein